VIKLKFSATRNLAEPQHAARKGVDIALAGDGYSSWITQFRWQNQPHCLLSRKTSQSHALMTVILEAEPHRTYTKTEVRCNWNWWCTWWVCREPIDDDW